MEDKYLDLSDEEVLDLIDEFEVDSSEYDEIKKEFTDMEKKSIKKILHKKINKKNDKKVMKVATIGTLILASGIFFSKPVFAERIEIFSDIYEALGYYRDYKDYTEYIGETKEDNGYKVTIEQLMGTPKKILYGIKVTNEKKFDENFRISENAISEEYSSKGGLSTYLQADEYTRYYYIESDAENEFPKRGEIDLNINGFVASDDIKDAFNVEFKDIKVDFSSSFKNSKTIKLNKRIEFGEDILKIKDMYTSLLETKLILKDTEISNYKALIDIDGKMYPSAGASQSGSSESNIDYADFDFDISSEEIAAAKSVKLTLYKNKATTINPEDYQGEEYAKLYEKRHILTNEEVNEKIVYKEENGIKYPSEITGFDGVVTYITKVEKNKNVLKVYYNSESLQVERGFDMNMAHAQSKIYKDKNSDGYIKEFDISKIKGDNLEIFANIQNHSILEKGTSIELIKN